MKGEIVMTKKAIALLASCILSSSSVSFLCAGSAYSVSADAMSGKCGQNAHWSFDTETGLLLIAGSGAMTDYDHPSAYNCKLLSPWYALRDEITAVRIQDGISSIGSYSFLDCTALRSAELPDSLYKIDESSFYGCSALETVNIPVNTYTINGRAFADCSSLKEISFPSSLNYIGPAAFFDCSSLKNVTFNEGITEVADNAFSNCSALSSVTLPQSLKEIAETAFGLKCQLIDDLYDYTKYENFEITGYDKSAAQKYAKSWRFKFNIISTQPDIPDSAEGVLSSSMSWTFEKSTGTLSINGSGDMPDYSSGVTPPWQDFSDGITNIVISSGVTGIGPYSFKGLNYLRTVTLPDTLSEIGKAAFAECDVLEAIVIPGSVRSIEDSAFSGCTSLKEITFSEGLNTIGSYAFCGCSSLERVELQEGLSAIGYEAFTNCTALDHISIPDTVGTIGEYAFGYTYCDGTYLTYSNKTAIYGSRDSAAERYASDYGIQFVCTDPEVITTTLCTSTAATTTTTTVTTADDTAGRLCSWAVKDYQDRKGLTGVTAKVLSASADNYVIALYNKNGKLLEVYTVDPSTGIGTDSAGYTVDLPQTGNNSPKDILVLAAALAATLSGLAAVWRSRVLRRKEDQQQ